MSEVITLKQFDGSTVAPKDDAIMYDYFGGETGLLEGCDLTHTGAGQIRIGAGRGIIKGRQFVVQEHTVNVTLSSDSDIPGRVYIRMDLSDTSEPVKILHVTAAVLPELEQDENCNNDNGVYEIELGIYTASKLTISNLEKTINRISSKLAKSMVVDNPDDVGAVTEQGYPVGCKALNGILGGIRFGVDDEGNYGYIKVGADTVTPFRNGAMMIGTFSGGYPSAAAATSKYTNLTTYANSIITIDGVLPSMVADDYIAVVTGYNADHYSNWAGSTSNGTGASLKIVITDNKTITVKNTGVCTINYAGDTQYRYHTRARVEGKVYYIGK